MDAGNLPLRESPKFGGHHLDQDWADGSSSPYQAMGRGRGRGRGRGGAEISSPGLVQSYSQLQPQQMGIPGIALPHPAHRQEAELSADNCEDPIIAEPAFDLDKFEVHSMIPREDEGWKLREKHPASVRAVKSETLPDIPTSGFPFSTSSGTVSVSEDNLSLTSTNEELVDCDEGGIPQIPCRVILRGLDVLKPYVNLKAFPFYELIKDGLKNIESINELQRVAWPHVLTGRNCCIVGGASDKSGKTLSYLVPMAATAINAYDMMKNKTQPVQTPYVGPIGIILCSGKASGKKIENHMRDLVGKHMTVYRGTRADSNMRRNLGDSPDFLICRPDFLLFINEKFPELFSVHRLRYMVMDDFHILDEEYKDSVIEVFKLLSHALERSTRRWPVQFIFCGEEWNNATVKEICGNESKFTNPVLIISSFTQALIYGKVNLQLVLVDGNEKLDRIAEIIRSQVAHHFVIVCQFREMAAKIGIYLYRSRQVYCSYLEEDDDDAIAPDQYAGLRRIWNNRSDSEPVVLVTTDDDLQALNLNLVTAIIHYEMPQKKQDAFGMRHMCMWDAFPDHNNRETESSQDLLSYVFISRDESELVKIVKFMETLNAVVPPELQKIVETNLHDSLKSSNFCDGINVYGKCNAKNKRKCHRISRHFFTKADLEADSTVPKFINGRVDLKIWKTPTAPNEYLALVLNFYQVKNGAKFNNISFTDLLQKRDSDLTKFYEIEQNRIPIPFVQMSCLCAINCAEKGEPEIYTRAKVHMRYQNSTGIEVARVFLIDRGVYKIMPLDDLYVLPAEFERMPPLTIRVIIAGMKPLGHEEEFRTNWKGLGENEINVIGKTMNAAVSLSIKDTIWVRTLREVEKVGCEWITKLDLRSEFIKKRHVAENNPDHLQTLHELCECMGFSCSIYGAAETIGEEFQAMDDGYEWAFLRTSSPRDPVQVRAVATFSISPDVIYLVQEQFEQQLDSLVKELNVNVDTLIKNEYSDYQKRFMNFYEKDLCVAAKDSEDLWARAIITDTYDDPNGGLLFDVHFVDHGDRGFDFTLKELFPLPKKFVPVLPFQAVAIRLHHIRPILDTQDCQDGTHVNENRNSRAWSVAARDCLMDNLISTEGECTIVDVVVLTKVTEKSADDPKCNYYNGFLLPTAQHIVELGEFLESNQMAVRVPEAWKEWEETKAALLQKYVDHTKNYLEQPEDNDEDETIDRDLNSLSLDDGEDTDDSNIEAYVGDPHSFLESLGLPIPPENGSTNLHPSRQANDREKAENVSNESPVASVHSDSFGLPTSRTGIKVPIVYWSQTKTHLALKIDLPDIKDYKLDLDETGQIVSFQSTDPANYECNISLFAKVRSPEETPLGQYMLVKLEKMYRGKWDYITRTKTPRWLKADLSSVVDSDSEDSDGFGKPDGSNLGSSAPSESVTDEQNKKTQTAQLADHMQFLNVDGDFGRSTGVLESDNDDSDSESEDDDIVLA